MKQLIENLFTNGYHVWDHFLTFDQVQNLRQCIPTHLKKACIGHLQQKVQLEQVRNDNIHWLAKEQGAPVESFLSKMALLKRTINRELFLGLEDYEAHFSRYLPNGFYKKHLDSFQHRNRRVISTITYLNDNWHKTDGGELVLYDMQDNILQQVRPETGRLVIFLSENHPHEVLKCRRSRFSIAGWFKTRGN